MHALVERGRAAVEAGDVEEAQRCAVAAEAKAPDDREVLLLLAVVRAAEEDGAGALAVLDRALALNPDDLGRLAAKAFLLLDVLGEPGEALPLLEEILAFAKEADAEDAEAEDELAALCFDVSLRLVDARLGCGDVDGAIAAASEAREIEDAPAARAALARALFAAGDVSDAALEIAAALKGNPPVPSFHVIAGRISSALGDDDAATKSFVRARALDPSLTLPPRLTPARFKTLVDDTLRRLPEPLGGYARKLPLELRIHAELERLREADASPSTPLLLEGEPAEPGEAEPFAHQPEAAVLYQRNVELLAQDEADVEAVLAACFVDAVASFLSLEIDEGELDEEDDPA